MKEIDDLKLKIQQKVKEKSGESSTLIQDLAQWVGQEDQFWFKQDGGCKLLTYNKFLQNNLNVALEQAKSEIAHTKAL